MTRSGFVVLSTLVFFVLLFFPGSSFADTLEYVTYNGFDPAVKAWTRVALIFSDVNYKGLFFGVIILGALAIYLATYVRMATGARIGNGLTWTVPVLIGAVMYIVFIQPKDKLVIYDEAQNRGPVTIDDIPRIIALPAGMLNKIERGFTNIVNTSSDPASNYRLNAGGIGWELIDTPLIVSKVSIPLRETLNSYIKNCVYLEITRNGTNLDITKIADGEQDLLYVINQSANSVWYTISYLNSQSGEAKTCSEVAPLLVAQFSQATLWESGIRATCAARGFDVQNVASYNACKSLLLSSVNAVYPNTDLANTFRQALFAHAITEVASSDSPAVMSSLLATRQTQSQFIGLGIHANSWIPVLKSSLTTVAVGITPVLLLFVATPLIGRALSLTLGMFVWLSMWGVIDSIIHGFGYDLAQQASAAIKSSPDYVGVQDMFLWPGYTAKVAATFGALRWAGLMLASVITGMLIRFGGTALAMLAGSISGMPQSSGAAYGRAAVEPGGVLSSDILPTMTWSNAAIATGGLSSLTRGLVQKQAGEMAGSSMFGNELGTAKIAQATRGSQLGGFVSGLGTGMAIDSVGVGNAVKAEAVQRAEQYQKGATLYDEYGGLSGAKRRGGISGQMYGDSFTGIEEQRSVYSKASGRNASYGNLSEAVSSGKKVVAYSGDRGYVQLGSGAIVFVDGNDNYALLGIDSPVKSSINEAETYREAGRALWSNKVTQRFANSLINKWFDSSSGEYRKEVGEQFRNTFSQAFLEKVASNESLSKTLGFKKDEEALWRVTSANSAEIGLSGPDANARINFETGIMTRYDKTTGIETRQQLTQEQLNEIKTAYDHAKHKGWDYVVSSRSGFEYVRSKAKEDSYEVGKAFEKSYEEAKSYGKTIDLTTQNVIFDSYVRAKYGVVTVDTVAKADADFRRMSATGDYSELWKTIDKPVTGADPETVKNKISEIQNEINTRGEQLKNQKLAAPAGNPQAVNPGVNLDIKPPDYSSVKGKENAVKELLEKFKKEHENTGALGLEIKDLSNTLTGPMDVLFGVDPMQNKNPLNPKNKKYTW